MEAQDPVFLDEPIFKSHLEKLIASKGELEGTGLSLQDIRNMIYTRRVKVDPRVAETAAAVKEKSTSTKRKKVDGLNVDDFLG